jgi:hypothetical protein
LVIDLGCCALDEKRIAFAKHSCEVTFIRKGPIFRPVFAKLGSFAKTFLVHQVSDWGSGVAIKMGRRQGATKEHI